MDITFFSKTMPPFTVKLSVKSILIFFFFSNFARKEHIQVKFRNASVRRKIHNTRHFLLRWSKKVIRKFCFEKWEISSRAYLQSKPCISGEKLFDCCQTIIRAYSLVKTRRGKMANRYMSFFFLLSCFEFLSLNCRVHSFFTCLHFILFFVNFMFYFD